MAYIAGGDQDRSQRFKKRRYKHKTISTALYYLYKVRYKSDVLKKRVVTHLCGSCSSTQQTAATIFALGSLNIKAYCACIPHCYTYIQYIIAFLWGVAERQH